MQARLTESSLILEPGEAGVRTLSTLTLTLLVA